MSQWFHNQSVRRNLSSNWIAIWALAACHEIGGLFQRFWTFCSTSHKSFVADSSLGKCPRTRTAFRTWLFRLSIALVV